MNKDALLATIIGFGIGLIITGAFIFGPNLVKSFPSLSFSLPQFSFPKARAPRETPAPTPQPQPTGLTISSPLPLSIEDTDELLVSGSVQSGATVVVAGGVDEAVVSSNGTGTYAGKIKLVEGENTLVVTSYVGGKQESQTVTVYYTPETL